MDLAATVSMRAFVVLVGSLPSFHQDGMKPQRIGCTKDLPSSIRTTGSSLVGAAL
jgi:hypothetical protein